MRVNKEKGYTPARDQWNQPMGTELGGSIGFHGTRPLQWFQTLR